MTSDLNALIERVIELDAKATPGPWKPEYREYAHRKGWPACGPDCKPDRVYLESAEDAAQFRGEREMHASKSDFVDDVLGPDGKHVVCLGGHDYDDSGTIEPSDAELIAAYRTAAPQLALACQRLAQENERLTKNAKVGPEHDNHHNAAQCPYCRPTLDKETANLSRLRARLEEVDAARKEGGMALVKALAGIRQFLASRPTEDQAR